MYLHDRVVDEELGVVSIPFYLHFGKIRSVCHEEDDLFLLGRHRGGPLLGLWAEQQRFSRQRRSAARRRYAR